MERAGRRVRYLNIGDPVQFGFATPAHLVEAVARAMRDGHNNYTASVGIVEAREAVAADFAARGVPVSPDRVLITSAPRTRAALTAIVDEGERSSSPRRPIRCIPRCSRRSARRRFTTAPIRTMGGCRISMTSVARSCRPRVRSS